MNKENQETKNYNLPKKMNKLNSDHKSSNQLKTLFRNDFILNSNVSSPIANKPQHKQNSKSKDLSVRSAMFSKINPSSKKNLNDTSIQKKSSYIKITSIGK